MKTAISIPDDVYEAAEQVAQHLGMSRSAFYTDAVQAFLKVHKRRGVTEKLNAVYSDDDSAVDPVLAAMQLVSLRREKW